MLKSNFKHKAINLVFLYKRLIVTQNTKDKYEREFNMKYLLSHKQTVLLVIEMLMTEQQKY